MIDWNCHQRNFFHSLTITPSYATRLNFWILLTFSMFICEIGNAVFPCLHVLKVTPGLVVNLHMQPQTKISNFIRGYWQIQRAQRRKGRQSRKPDFLRESEYIHDSYFNKEKATKRLNCSSSAWEIYSGREFQLGKILPGSSSWQPWQDTFWSMVTCPDVSQCCLLTIWTISLRSSVSLM